MEKLIKREILILFIIFTLSLFLRLYWLGEIPHGFHADEVMNGYVGRFIILNGKDLYGNLWPLFYFDRFGDFPPVLPMYLSGLATFVFGVNEFAVRFPSALFGALFVFPVFFLGRLIFRNGKVALIASLLAAILPWHIVLSRATSEGILGLTVFSFALFLLLRGLHTEDKLLIISSLAIMAITYFLYPSFKILTPLALLPSPFLTKTTQKIKPLLVFSTVFFIFLTWGISSTEWGRGRFLQISLFQNEEVARRIHSSLETLSSDERPVNVTLARIFHSKPIAYGQEFLRQYLSYFSPEFLFTKGGLPTRYVVPEVGLLPFTFFLLIFFAFLPQDKGINKPFFSYFLYLLLIAPLPAALTIDDVPNIHRAILMILPLIFTAALGFAKIENFKYKIFSPYLWLGLFLIIESIYFFHQYLRHTASFKSFLRNDGNREVILSLKKQEAKFQKIMISTYDTLPLYYLFFTNNFDPSLAGKFRRNIEINQIGKVEFIEDWCSSKKAQIDKLPAKTLIIDNGDCEGKAGLKDIELILRKDSTRAFKLLVSEEETLGEN